MYVPPFFHKMSIKMILDHFKIYYILQNKSKQVLEELIISIFY